jgi:hypothetical protein
MRRFTVVAAVCLIAAFSGCGGSKRVDPQSSAEALFEHVVELSRRPVPDAEALCAIVHWENDRQELWRYFVHSQELPHFRFMNACYDQFGVVQFSGVAFFVRIESLRIVSNDVDRAAAECQIEYGESYHLHLVRLGDRWHVSGDTFEQHPRIDAQGDPEGFDYLTRSLPGIASCFEPVTAAVRAGLYADAQHALDGFLAARDQYYRDHGHPGMRR